MKRSSGIAALLGLVLLLLGAGPALAPQDLRAEWTFAEASGTSAADSTGNGAAGTLVGGSAWTMGRIGVGVALDGTNAAVRLPDNLSTLQNVGAATVTAWIRMSSLPASGAFREIASFSVGAASPTNSSRFAMAVRGDGTAADLFVGGRSTDTESQKTALGDANMGLDQWYLVTGVIDFGAGTIKVYRGSVLLLTQSVSFSSPTTANTPSRNAALGAQDMADSNFFHGAVDEVRVYARALSQAEIERLATGNGLRAQWKLDEGTGAVAGDSSFENYPGTLVNNPAWMPGVRGSALSFDGLDDHVSLGSNLSILRNVNGATVTAWVRPGSVLAAGSFRELVSLSVNAGAPTPVSRVALALRGDGTGGDLFAGGRSTDSETQKTLTDDASLAVGEWTHVAGVIDLAGGTIALYKNGSQTASAPAAFAQPRTPNTVSTSATIGAQDDASGNFFHGDLDDVRVYGRALTGQEVRDLVMKDCLMAHWKFDEGTGSSAGDASGNGVAGTLAGGATWGTGQFGSAVSLDGVDGRVTLPDNLTMLRNTPAATLAGWVKLSSLPASGAFRELVSISVGSASPTNLSRAALAIRGDGTAADVFAGGRTSDTEAQQTLVADANLAVGTFTHVAAVLSYSNDTIKIYVNGQLAAQALVDFSLGATADTDSRNGALGAQDMGNANFLHGLLDEVRIYCRALSSEEILALATVAVPPAPTNLQAAAGDTKITLTWNASAGATSYNIYRSLQSASYNFGSPLANTSQTTYVDMGLTNGTEYFYVVKAVNAAGESLDHSNEDSAIPEPSAQPPAKPIITTLPKKTNDPTPNLAGTSDPSVTIRVFFNGDPDPVTTTANFMGQWSLEPSAHSDGTYSITARAENAAGNSPLSDPVTITIDRFVNPPSGVTLTALNTQIHVNWTASPDPDVIGYEVWRSAAGGSYVKIHSGLIVGTFYCDGPLTNGTQYCYQIRAVDNTLQEVAP